MTICQRLLAWPLSDQTQHTASLLETQYRSCAGIRYHVTDHQIFRVKLIHRLLNFFDFPSQPSPLVFLPLPSFHFKR
jgi:hypothetical protein